jgi:hypothetical protein
VSLQRSWRRRLTGRFGDPLALLALLGCFALAGYAASRVVVAGPWLGIAVWFVGAAIGHDLVLYPLYALADTAAQGRRRRRDRPLPVVAGVPWINYLRVPAGLSLLLLAVWFPLILGVSAGPYRGAAGLGTGVYLGRWLAVTGVVFLGSAVLYALRVRRAPRLGP